MSIDEKGRIRSEIFRSELRVSVVGRTMVACPLKWNAVIILSDFIFHVITDDRFIFHFVCLIQGKIRRMNCRDDNN
jgi:hypothetical protein